MKRVLPILAVLVIIAIVGFYFAGQGNDTTPERDLDTQSMLDQLEDQFDRDPVGQEDEADMDMEQEPDPVDQPATRTVSMQGGSFSPSVLEINAGDTVVFRNDGPGLYWPASDPHPTHTGLPGFDAQRALEPGESWSFRFNIRGTFGYHDHLNPVISGTIIVR